MSQQVFDFLADARPHVASIGDPAPSVRAEIIRVVIVGSQLIAREGLRVLLTGIAGFRVVGEADDGAAGLHVASGNYADVLVVDVPPVRDYDFDFLFGIALESMRVRVLLLVSPPLGIGALAAIRLGAHGVLSKDSANSQDLCAALRSVYAGRYWLGDWEANGSERALELFGESRAADATHRRFGLTPRELQLVPLMAHGYSNRDIARTLSISVETVKHHCSHIYDKIGASNRLELALFAIHHQLVSQTGPLRINGRDNPQHAR